MFFFTTIKNSLLIKWVLGALLIITLVLTLLVSSALQLLDSVTEAQIRSHNSKLATLINSVVATSLFTRDSALANDMLDRLLKRPEEQQDLSYVLIYDNKGSLFAQSGSINPDLLPAKKNSLAQARMDGIYNSHSLIKSLDNKVLGSAHYGFSPQNIIDGSHLFRRQGTIVTVSALSATAILFGLFGLVLTRQLKKLISGTHGVVAGDYTTKVEVSSQDEIGQLSCDFNKMVDAIRDKTDTIEENKRFLQGITDNIEGMIYSCTNDGRCTLGYVSAGAEKLTGHSAKLLMKNSGFDFSDLIVEEDRDFVEREIQHAFNKSQKFSIMYRIQTLKGEIKWVLDRGGQVTNDESLIEGIIVDITAQKQAEINQQKAEQQSIHYLEKLAQLDRVNTLGEMAAGIAHEINQPLTSIAIRSGAARRRLASKKPDMDKIDKALAVISEQALRAGNVMQRIRKLVSVHLNERERVYPDELLKEALKIARIDGTLVDIRIESRFAPDLPPVLVDKIQIQQVILNLLRNAQDAMQTLPVNERIIVLKSTKLDEHVQISVIDNGSGIDLDTESQLLDAFFTTKKTGMGMGLSICRTIITAHTGQLWFSRNENQGVSFHITLPIVDENEIAMEITNDP